MTERRRAASFLPTTAVLELTYRCNHTCIFCSCPWEDPDGSFKQRSELNTEEWGAAISKLCQMGVSNIALTGGEPLERDDIAEIITHAASCQVEHIKTENDALVSYHAPPNIYLLSNGRSVDGSVLEMCKEYGVQLSVSLPGLETFAEHTGFDGADGVLQIFSKAKRLGLKTVVNITVTKLNLHELDIVIGSALLAGADQVLLNRFLPGGRGLIHNHQLALSSDELQIMLSVAESTLMTANRFGSLGTEVPKCVVNPSDYKNLDVSTRCAAGIGFFVIGPSGFIRVCNHSTVELNHIDEINNLKTNEYWNTFTQKRYLPTICQNCIERSVCDGGCREAAHIVGGKIVSPDILMEKPLGGRPSYFHI